MDTRALALKATTGDPAAIDALLERNLGRLRAFIRARCGPLLRAKESCSDLVQTVCREVLEDMGGFQYEDEARFRHWLFKRAEHKLVDRVRYWEANARDAAREAPPGSTTGDEEDLESAFVTFLTPSRELISREKVRRIQAALDAGAEVIAVACPTCLVNLKEGAKAFDGLKIDIQEVASLVQRNQPDFPQHTQAHIVAISRAVDAVKKRRHLQQMAPHVMIVHVNQLAAALGRCQFCHDLCPLMSVFTNN